MATTDDAGWPVVDYCQHGVTMVPPRADRVLADVRERWLRRAPGELRRRGTDAHVHVLLLSAPQPVWWFNTMCARDDRDDDRDDDDAATYTWGVRQGHLFEVRPRDVQRVFDADSRCRMVVVALEDHLVPRAPPVPARADLGQVTRVRATWRHRHAREVETALGTRDEARAPGHRRVTLVGALSRPRWRRLCTQRPVPPGETMLLRVGTDDLQHTPDTRWWRQALHVPRDTVDDDDDTGGAGVVEAAPEPEPESEVEVSVETELLCVLAESRATRHAPDATRAEALWFHVGAGTCVPHVDTAALAWSRAVAAAAAAVSVARRRAWAERVAAWLVRVHDPRGTLPSDERRRLRARCAAELLVVDTVVVDTVVADDDDNRVTTRCAQARVALFEWMEWYCGGAHT